MPLSEPLSEDVEVRATARHLPDALAVPLLPDAVGVASDDLIVVPLSEDVEMRAPPQGICPTRSLSRCAKGALDQWMRHEKCIHAMTVDWARDSGVGSSAAAPLGAVPFLL